MDKTINTCRQVCKVKNEEFERLTNKLLFAAEKVKDSDKEVHLSLLEAIEALQNQRSKLLSFREAAATKAYDAIYIRGGWKSDGHAAADAIRLIDPFDS